MRPIIFRGWHEEDKVMVYKINSLRLFDGELKPDDYVLMQYTGLLDKNGARIFENDIVKHNLTFTDKRDCFAIVKFSTYDDDEGYSTNQHLGWHLEDVKHSGSRSLIDLHEQIEVIGNIHQHPELLDNNK